MSCRVLLLVAVLFWAIPAAAQSPTPMERTTIAMLLASSSVSMIPVWITAMCTGAGTCREVNPVMRRLIGAGPVRAIVFKSGMSFVAHYAVWGLPAHTKKQQIFRLVLAGTLLAINGWDAANDIRALRRITKEQNR